MIVSHEWISEFVSHGLSAAEAGNLLSRHTVTLDGIEPTREDLATFVVGLVVECAPHPDSDHLSVTKVDDGSGALLDVVCGASNVTAGNKYPFARTGTVMPDGLVIAKRKIRGAVSNGMLCSARELGLGDDHDGIYTLQTDAAPGTPLLSILPVGDFRLDLDVLPNRPDLLSHLGVAREISAITGKPLRMPAELPVIPSTGSANKAVKPVLGTKSAEADGVSISIEDIEACPRYTGIVIRGISVGASPEWLASRLASVGLRSINNVVDATNYILHGLGQPVHAFDLSMIAGRTVSVRKIESEKSLVTLDGIQRQLAAGTTAICDGEGPIALAGIMGGEASEVNDSTIDIFLETAWFDPAFVRKIRRAMHMSTDASYRFERGVDFGFTVQAARYAAELIVAVAGGKVTAIMDIGRSPASPSPVIVRNSRVNRLLGAEISGDDIVRTLEAVGCTVGAVNQDSWSVTPPTWRTDLGLEVDCIEETARLLGFDSLPEVIQPFRPGRVPDHPIHVSSRRVRDACFAFGLSETRPMPFVATGASESLRVRNPLAEDEPYLRGSLLETLIARAEYNLSRMQGNIRLFEIGSAFLPGSGRLPVEEVRVAALIMGASRPPHFTEPEPPAFDEWDIKALAETIVSAAFPAGGIELRSGSDSLWDLVDSSSGENVGVVKRLDLDRPVWAAVAYGVELTLGLMSSSDVAAPGRQSASASSPIERPASPYAGIRYSPLPNYPSTSFDLALLVPQEMLASQVEQVLRSGSGELLESLDLFDEYRGSGLPSGMRSLAWRLTLRHPERTLKDKEIEGRRSRLLQTLERELGVRLRTN